MMATTGETGPRKVTLPADKNGVPLVMPEIAHLTKIIGKAGIVSHAVMGTANPLLYPDASAPATARCAVGEIIDTTNPRRFAGSSIPSSRGSG